MAACSPGSAAARVGAPGPGPGTAIRDDKQVSDPGRNRSVGCRTRIGESAAGSVAVGWARRAGKRGRGARPQSSARQRHSRLQGSAQRDSPRPA